MALFSTKDTPPQQRSSEPQTAHSGTFFGPNVTIDGTVTGSEPILIEGTVRGKINLTGDLRVGTKARIEAAVHAGDVQVVRAVTLRLREAHLEFPDAALGPDARPADGMIVRILARQLKAEKSSTRGK